MKKSLIAIQLVLFLQCTVCSYAQEVITSSSSSRESGDIPQTKEVQQERDVQDPSGTKVFDLVDEIPKFGIYTYTVTDSKTGKVKQYSVKGAKGLNVYLSRNIRYPVIAEENRIQGRVICSVDIDVDGSIKSVIVVNGVDPSLDREAKRVLRSMPKWIPGKLKGEPDIVRLTIPIDFRL